MVSVCHSRDTGNIVREQGMVCLGAPPTLGISADNGLIEIKGCMHGNIGAG